MTETVLRLGAKGDGVTDGGFIAPMTLPGEQITGTPVDGHLTDIKIVVPSADRVKPPCRHFKGCGGCAVQHASDRTVAAWKLAQVTTALARAGVAHPPPSIATSPANSRRRATLAGRRTKSGAMIGFFGRASDQVIDTPDCTLLTPALTALRPALIDLVRLGASRTATVSLALTDTDTGVDVLVENGKPLDGPMRVQLAGWAQAAGVARLTWGDALVVEHVPPRLSLGQAQIVPPPGAFLQATVAGQQALTDAVCASVGDAKRVVDLFAGCGTFSLPLASTAKVHAVEGAAELLTALDGGWRRAQGLKPITTERRDLFRNPLLPQELSQFDAVVIDPPRAGAQAQTTELARAGVPRVAFVSCNPVSFARDAAILCAAGYQIDTLLVVDQFRWSGHVELVAGFTTSA